MKKYLLISGSPRQGNTKYVLLVGVAAFKAIDANELKNNKNTDKKRLLKN